MEVRTVLEQQSSSSSLALICLHISTVRLDAKLRALPPRGDDILMPSSGTDLFTVQRQSASLWINGLIVTVSQNKG